MKREKYVLMFDVDWKPPKEDWVRSWIELRKWVLREVWGFEVKEVYLDYTERGFHVWIHFLGPPGLDDETILMLQFLLGDDATRCKINHIKISRGFKDWNRLFAKVIYRRKAEYVARCQYCGNIIPLVGFIKKEDCPCLGRIDAEEEEGSN